MKKFFLGSLFVIFVLALYGFTFRGTLGNPTPDQIDYDLSSSGQAFETSQERSRYAIILSLVNNHRFDLGEYASMGTPDIGQIKGKYYSFFPPATSVLAIPLYLLGVHLGAAQIFTFSISTIFALLTLLMIYLFAKKLSLSSSIALYAAIAFGFATNAWGYSVTFYAHLLSAFSILAGIYFAVMKKETWVNTLVVWLLYAFAIYVDFPNIFTFFPIALLAGLRFFVVSTDKKLIKIKLNLLMLIGPILFVGLMGIYGYYNYVHFGNPLKFSNTIDRVKDLKNINNARAEQKDLEAVGALSTRKLINGLYTFSVSHDRGLLIYSPVALLFIFGLSELFRRDSKLKLLLLGVPLVNLLTYSMFGDPWGGWAFGSRYMISILPELIIISALGLSYFKSHHNKFVSYLVPLIFAGVFAYSSSMSLLAPLTTNVIPPTVEAGTFSLADDSRINRQMLKNTNLNSYFYKLYLRGGNINGERYYYLILIPLNLVAIALIFWPVRKLESRNHVRN